MLNVITNTTKKVTSDGDEFTVTTYTVGGYTLVRTESSDRVLARWNIRAHRDLPTITDMSNFDAETPEFGVNWSACGTRSSVDARVYAAQLATAADVADVFNRIAASN